jgi:hypothetical protein
MDDSNTNNPPPPQNPNAPGFAAMQSPSPTSPNQPALPVHKPLTPFTILKRIVLTILGIICLLGVWETFFPTKPPTINTNPSPSTIPNQPVTWKTYANKQFHYTIKYPDNLEMSQDSAYSTVFQIKNRQQLVFPSLYISVIPDGTTNTQIYNYMPPNIINNFFTLQQNATQLIQPDQDPQYWTYTKMATLPIANTEAVLIQNNNVWQAQNGEINRRVLLKAKGVTYIIGSYYTNQQGLDNYHDFLMSFTLAQ